MAAQQTLVRKITVGTPVRRVVGAQAQTLTDLLDVNLRNVQDGDAIVYDAATGKWKNESSISGGTF
jgi:hypothetical protein